MSNAAIEQLKPAATMWNSFTVVGANSNPNPEDQQLQEEIKEDGVDPNEEVKVEPVKEKPPEPEKKPEPRVESKKEPSEATRENFAKLQKKAQEAEERASKLQSELKALEERSSQFNPEDFQKQIQEREERLAHLQNELRFVALERDPDFIAKHDKPREILQDSLKEMALAAGVPAEDFQRAYKLGLQERLEEIRDNLQPAQQRKWDAALTEIERVALQREIALKNRDQTIEEVITNRQREAFERSSRQTQQNLQIASRVAMEPFEKIEGLRDDVELQTQVKSTLEAIAGGNGAENWDSESIMRQVAASVVLPKILTAQAQALQQKDEEMAALKKELEEANSFIKSKHGSLPRNEVSTKQDKQEDKRMLWDKIKVVR